MAVVTDIGRLPTYRVTDKQGWKNGQGIVLGNLGKSPGGNVRGMFRYPIKGSKQREYNDHLRITMLMKRALTCYIV